MSQNHILSGDWTTCCQGELSNSPLKPWGLERPNPRTLEPQNPKTRAHGEHFRNQIRSEIPKNGQILKNHWKTKQTQNSYRPGARHRQQLNIRHKNVKDKYANNMKGGLRPPNKGFVLLVLSAFILSSLLHFFAFLHFPSVHDFTQAIPEP